MNSVNKRRTANPLVISSMNGAENEAVMKSAMNGSPVRLNARFATPLFTSPEIIVETQAPHKNAVTRSVIGSGSFRSSHRRRSP